MLDKAVQSKEWPVAEGRYKVGNPDSPIAVCTMASIEMDMPMDKIAIIGKCVTENLGIEKIVKNTISNPKIRYLIFCGKESHGHFVGQAMKSLNENGVDGEKRIIGAKGGMPVLKNLEIGEIERFREQVEIVDMSGEADTAKILARVNELFENNPGPFEGGIMETKEEIREARAEVHPITEWVRDPQGFFTIYP
ncbi:MAG: tetrahydromethanopterin S-methyltransferase subunit A, partial [Candidatus Aenigmatarchaeota archaeon]